ncbi:hypothetical protein [Vulcanococcus limneticus]|uniref:hypothetical protein n=1 Tax=Vulcanococcus limneticus TaxID=2170428 RepID=UPI00398BE863
MDSLNSMTTFKYIGQRYIQGDSSQEMYVFLANADDIYAWGGVPAKNEQFHGGFQRALDDRYKKIIRFFDADQSSPGAIVVAFRQGVLKATSLGMPDAWPAEDSLSSRETLENRAHPRQNTHVIAGAYWGDG